MNVVIDGTRCPVVTQAIEPLVLHPRYHALRLEVLDPGVGLFVLSPISRGDRALLTQGDGADITVTWIGDIMEQVALDVVLAVELEAAED